mmetsp:Transcript_29443/g.85652  ORF Transcript_29443/g.85652 Transcript_29443/m.85652 type:complete len:255 (+) Transcript_29443:104-868(+)
MLRGGILARIEAVVEANAALVSAMAVIAALGKTVVHLLNGRPIFPDPIGPRGGDFRCGCDHVASRIFGVLGLVDIGILRLLVVVRLLRLLHFLFVLFILILVVLVLVVLVIGRLFLFGGLLLYFGRLLLFGRLLHFSRLLYFGRFLLFSRLLYFGRLRIVSNHGVRRLLYLGRLLLLLLLLLLLIGRSLLAVLVIVSHALTFLASSRSNAFLILIFRGRVLTSIEAIVERKAALAGAVIVIQTLRLPSVHLLDR